MPLVDRPTIHVRRTSVFTDSIDYLNGPVEILVAGRLSVHFIGEEGMEISVLQRDWYTSVNRAMYESDTTDSSGGLFKLQDRTDHLVINTDRILDESTRSRYAAVGRMLALSLVNRVPNGAPLPRFFWAALLNDNIVPEDLRIGRD